MVQHAEAYVRNFQEPSLNATTLAGNLGNDVGQNPFASLLGNQAGVQSIDQTSGQPGIGSNLTSKLASPNNNPLPNPWSRTGTFCIGRGIIDYLLKLPAIAGGAQTTNTRPAPPSDGRSSGIGGLGELGLPEFGRMAGGMPNPSFVNQLLQKLAIMQVMRVSSPTLNL